MYKTDSEKYVIAFDLHSNNREDYKELFGFFEELKTIQIQNTVYALKSQKSGTELCDIFKKYIRNDDGIFVMKLTKWAACNLMSNLENL